MKTTIGIATYNGADRVKLLLSSIDNYINDKERDNISIVVVDDGTPYRENLIKLDLTCNKHQVRLIRHEKNRGIAATWNTLTRFDDTANLIVLFNDDIQISHPDWLKNLTYFFEHNDNIGHVSYQILNMDPYIGMPKVGYSIPNIECLPQFSLTPGGQAFAFLKDAYTKIDGGFCEDLTSFYEETTFGYEVSQLGYYSYIIPFPVMQHWGSQTFALNEELNFTTPNDKLSLEKYRDLLCSRFSNEKIEPRPGKVYRMEYSRVLFALKWNCKDIFDQPQNEVEERLLHKFSARLIRWIDSDNNERESLI